MKNFSYIILSTLVLFCNCKNDDDLFIEEEEELILTENIETYNGDLVENSLVFAVENGGSKSYLLDKSGNKVKEWSFSDNLGNDLELLPEGQLLGIFKVDDPAFFFGGYGGLIKIINDDGSTDWEYEYASSNYIAHHDVELLPNGNVLFLAWEKIDTPEAQSNGVSTTNPIYPEALIEVNPTTNEIVWQWRSFDHIIQDQNAAASNFGSVSDNPQLIDINYDVIDNGDLMHANGIDYDSDKDIIYISVNYYSEVWVIDHSTTTAQAATNNGGNYNKGGDLLYRFGNPSAYKNTEGARLFYNNHFPNLLEMNEPGAGNILVYMNGVNNNQSVVYEFEMPTNFDLISNTDNEPSVVWSFTDAELFHGRISGAVRLRNGNTLIAEGDYGFWEVTQNGDIAWKYNGLGPNYWRCYNYNLDDQEILDLNLE
ncbi:arylsulfotransferase family protein [Psychroserpens sp. SPM9]|uniref:arylsulfotransferase family protein n=1 Tax=Psychroserpens sp. SPM9 TaxID=2975598 RepID=UPI0021A68324|nr:arylsulfotransferase family protein [Psychroserpens sp. SPM9]MDG5489984.1 arylsulfotransferase family protein [Psychroserpens sp. SPM9]